MARAVSPVPSLGASPTATRDDSTPPAPRDPTPMPQSLRDLVGGAHVHAAHADPADPRERRTGDAGPTARSAGTDGAAPIRAARAIAHS
ncbi:MAG: hypothetical protein QNJ91_14980 [Gammaproteobacteria bacterium]|nr:hypothetical protein [Gammaproteobacteria bacterium]